MAGKKHRKTMARNWKKISGSSSEDSFSAKRPKDNISYVKRERNKRMQKTSMVLTKLCDNDDDSGTDDIKRRPFRPSLPVSITENHDKNVSPSSHDSSCDAGQSEVLKSKLQMSKMSSRRNEKIKSNSSETDSNSDSDFIDTNHKTFKGNKIQSRKKNSTNENKSSKGKTLKNQSGFCSSEEFEKSKSDVRKKSKANCRLDNDSYNYSLVETPSKSDDDKIAVDPLLEIKLKNIIVEELEKLQKLVEDLQSTFKLHSKYLVKKKVNVVSDSKFIPHKLLGLYDETFKKLKQNRNEFLRNYESWLNKCTERTTLLKHILKTGYSSNESTEDSIKRFDVGSDSEYERVITKFVREGVEEFKSDRDSNKQSSKPNSSTSDAEEFIDPLINFVDVQMEDPIDHDEHGEKSSETEKDSNELNKSKESSEKQKPVNKSKLSSKLKFENRGLPVCDTIEENAIDSGITDLSNNEVQDVKKPDVEERQALNDLLHDWDSDASTYRASKFNSDSDRSVDSNNTWKEGQRNQLETLSSLTDNTLLKKKSELKMQTNKKQNYISSNSSSSASEDENTRCKKNVRSRSCMENSSGDDLPLIKRRRLAPIAGQNRFIKADKKLLMVCQVVLKHLPNRILRIHAKALERSKRFLAQKKLCSAVNIDSLETKKSKKNPVKSDDDFVKTKPEKRNKEKKTKPLKNISDEHNDIESDDDELKSSHDTGEINDLPDRNNTEQAIVDEVENQAVKDLLDSCSSNNEEDVTEMDMDNEKDKKPKKTKAKNKNDKKYESAEESENEDENKDKKSWKQDKLLKVKLTDSESEEEKFKKSQEKKKAKKDEAENDKSSNDENLGSPGKKSQGRKTRKQRKKLVLDSDSDIIISSDEESKGSDKASGSNEEKEEKKKKTKKRRRKSSSSDYSESGEKKSARRKRIKNVDTDSDDNDEQDSPGKGRKNIRKVLRDKHVADDTKKAAQDEEERLKRIAERQRLFNEMYDAKLAGEAKVDKLVLDFDEETKRELVVVDEELVKRLKPHQAQGIKFMWDACFESLTQIEKSEGSGCIIAHCMGLGKTFQVVTLAHTLLSNEKTGVETVMIVCPLSTVLNWVNEFKMWLKHVKNGDDIEIYELTKLKKNTERKYMLESWKKTGGVLIIGYEMFRNLTSTGKKMRKAMQESVMRSLVDPGADLVVCDEGHLLKNEESALSKAMKLVKTMRRVVLTGTPLQNNLKEYHCMVQFVKPNLLGTKKEFLNRFVNPITNGQFDDSTPYDVKLMKKRAHVLHKMLEGSVQRFDYSVLTPFLPPKQEYVIFVRLTDVQIKMYQHYLDNFARRFGGRNGSLFADFQELQRIWTHPYVLRLNAEKVDKVNEKKRLEASDSEGSLKDFIDDGSDSDSICSSSSQGSASGSDVQCIDSDSDKPVVKTRSTRLNPKEEPEEVPNPTVTTEEASWWSKYLEEKHFEDLRTSTKLKLLFGILKESEQIGDKVLVFSQSLYSLTLIEYFLNLIDQQSMDGGEAEHLDNHSGTWSLGLDYFRLDGSTSAENRSAWCKIFNNPNNTRARLFLISTRAGGLGINLTAANRVIIFDASWNPSHDVQSIFRIYRFGQKKPCYVYRFLAAGTMEEKIYNRQVTKLSLACRVVDEQQIERHYSNNDLAELYQFESYENESVTLNLPKDRLLAEIFLKHKDSVYNYHEHDSLLENKAEEELDEEERKQAWQEYEDEKQGKRQIINMGMGMGVGMGMGMGNNMLGFNQMLMNMNNFPEMESIKLLIQKDYPNLPPEHLETVARQALYDMYRYVDQQAISQTLTTNVYAQPSMFGGSMQQQPLNHQQHQYQLQNQMMNLNPLNQPQINYPGVNQMPVYSGRGRPPKHLSMNNQMTNLQKQLLNPIQLQQPQIPTGDVEIISNSSAPSNANAASNSNDIQEEVNNIQEK